MDARFKHGHSSAAGRSPTYRSWHSMKQRVKNPNATGCKNYGGRGIDMSPDWELFANFLRDMGERPPGCSLERIDNNIGYHRENCKWAPVGEQLRNKRNNVFIEHDGKRMTVKDWSTLTGIPFTTLRTRMKAGWATERVLSKERFAKNQFT